MKTDDKTLIAAMRKLARDMESPDGVANDAIEEAANRLEELTRAKNIPNDERFWLLIGKLGALSDDGLRWLRTALAAVVSGELFACDVDAVRECLRLDLIDWRGIDQPHEIVIDRDVVTLWSRCPHLFPGGA